MHAPAVRIVQVAPMLVCLTAGAVLGCKGTADTDPTAGQSVLDPDRAEVARSPATGLRLTVAERGSGPTYLTDAAGRPLYVRVQNGSRCDALCEAHWPSVGATHPPAEAAHANVQPGLIGTVLREDGRLQVTYAGRRLYYHNAPSRAEHVPTRVSDAWGDWAMVAPDGSPASDAADPERSW